MGERLLRCTVVSGNPIFADCCVYVREKGIKGKIFRQKLYFQ